MEGLALSIGLAASSSFLVNGLATFLAELFNFRGGYLHRLGFNLGFELNLGLVGSICPTKLTVYTLSTHLFMSIYQNIHMKF